MYPSRHILTGDRNVRFLSSVRASRVLVCADVFAWGVTSNPSLLVTDNVSQLFEEFWVRLVYIAHLPMGFHMTSGTEGHKICHCIGTACSPRNEMMNFGAPLALTVSAVDLALTSLACEIVSPQNSTAYRLAVFELVSLKRVLMLTGIRLRKNVEYSPDSLHERRFHHTTRTQIPPQHGLRYFDRAQRCGVVSCLVRWRSYYVHKSDILLHSSSHATSRSSSSSSGLCSLKSSISFASSSRIRARARETASYFRWSLCSPAICSRSVSVSSARPRAIPYSDSSPMLLLVIYANPL